MEALVYIANTLYLASYFMQDLLRLRLLTITAAICLVGYFYLRPEPLMTVVCWNLFFVALNVFQIGRLVVARHRDADSHGREWSRRSSPSASWTDRSRSTVPRPRRAGRRGRRA